MKPLAALLTALLVLTAPGVAVATPGPADAQDVTRLVHAVAAAEQQLNDQQLLIGGEREKVNRAVVGAQQALVEARTAQRAEDAAGTASTAAHRQLERAQDEFDDFAAAAYMNGPSAAGLLGGDPGEVIETAVQMQAISLRQRAATGALAAAQQVREDEHRRARATAASAQRAVAVAADRRDEAVRSLADAQRTLEDRQRTVAQLVAERDAAQAALDAAVGAAGAAVPGSQGAQMTSAAREPAEVIARLMSVAEESVRETSAMGGAFLAQLGLVTPLEGARTGMSYGQLPTGVGRRASEVVIARALSQRGIAYSWGGGGASGPTRGIDGGEHIVGFDCSGLMMYAFAGVGIALPHYSGSQYEMGARVPVAQMRRGDVLFYGENGGQHVALYLGDNLMVEAPNAGSVVRVSPVRHAGMTPYAVRYIDF
ncbi:NlpC/P60 family protein [Mycobacterium sp. NPDC003323]